MSNYEEKAEYDEVCAREHGVLEVSIAVIDDINRNIRSAVEKSSLAGDKLFGSIPNQESGDSKTPTLDGQIDRLRMNLERVNDTITELHHSLDRLGGL